MFIGGDHKDDPKVENILCISIDELRIEKYKLGIGKLNLS
jgi:hypothetical protein